MSQQLRFTLETSTHAIGHAIARLSEFASCYGMDDDAQFKLDLCANELLANVAEHAYAGAVGEVGLELLLDSAGATLTVVDNGPRFDPFDEAALPLPTSLATARIGGLGLHLVRRFADAVRYERVGNCNRLTVEISGESTLLHPPATVTLPDAVPDVTSAPVSS